MRTLKNSEQIKVDRMIRVYTGQIKKRYGIPDLYTRVRTFYFLIM
ncbi:MAG TPA: hypothetical protein VK469_00420 [Candidatus Kapabacteria bacterium]|nr:hypothetical protein [Candidatus Kapabacteria bacterium]